MYNYNVFISCTGWGIGANIDLYNEMPRRIIIGSGLAFLEPLIYNWQNKTVHPRESTTVIGIINRFFYIPAPAGFPFINLEDSKYNFKEVFNNAANGNVELEKYQIDYIKRLNGE